MPAMRLREKSSRVALKVGISLLVAAGIAGLVHVLIPPSGAAQQSAPLTQTYSIDPASVALTTTDVGPTVSLVNEGRLGPSQHTAPGHPLPYQQQFFGGWARNFMVQSALVPPGRTEIDNYTMQLGIQPSDPTTIIGPFVVEHHGLFEVSDFEVSYHQASAAHPTTSAAMEALRPTTPPTTTTGSRTPFNSATRPTCGAASGERLRIATTTRSRRFVSAGGTVPSFRPFSRAAPMISR